MEENIIYPTILRLVQLLLMILVLRILVEILLFSIKNGIENINELHPLYMALQFHLLFSYREYKFKLDIFGINDPRITLKKNKFVTMIEYCKCR